MAGRSDRPVPVGSRSLNEEVEVIRHSGIAVHNAAATVSHRPASEELGPREV
jgi:hypothetical protein